MLLGSLLTPFVHFSKSSGKPPHRGSGRGAFLAATQQSRVMRRVHHHAMPRGLRMPREHLTLMKDLVMAELLVHPDGASNVGDRHRVTRRADRHQGVVGHTPLLDSLVMLGRPQAKRRELFAGETHRRAFMRSTVDPLIGDLGAPAFEPVRSVPPRS